MFWIYFDFYIGPCLFAAASALNYISSEAATCDGLSNNLEYLVCLAGIVELLEALVEGVTSCIQG